MNKKNMDMLNGSISDKILLFALPLAASSILQQLFNSADIAVVGRWVGSDSLAAVGSTGPVIGLLINLFVGLSIGTNVTAARFLGQNDNDGVQRTVHTSILLAFLSGLMLLLAGQLVIKPILTAMSTPQNVMPLATLYMRIYFVGMPFLMLYNFGSALLRSIGDTTRPLLALFTGGVLNVALNLFFVLVCGMGVDGVAIATVCSNIVSSALVLTFLIREKGALHLSIKKLGLDKDILKNVAGIGVPAGVQGIVFSLSNVCIQGAINGFGSVAVAGSSAALNAEYYTFFFLNSFGQACTTFVSQNMGAGNLKRCKSIVMRAALMSAAVTLVVSGLFILLDRQFLSIFTTEQEVIEFGVTRIHVVIGFQILNAMLEVFSGALRGMGHSLTPALIAVIGVCGVRLLYVFTIFKLINTFSGLLWIYPISWIITSISIATAFVITYTKKVGQETVQA